MSLLEERRPDDPTPRRRRPAGRPRATQRLGRTVDQPGRRRVVDDRRQRPVEVAEDDRARGLRQEGGEQRRRVARRHGATVVAVAPPAPLALGASGPSTTTTLTSPTDETGTCDGSGIWARRAARHAEDGRDGLGVLVEAGLEVHDRRGRRRRWCRSRSPRCSRRCPSWFFVLPASPVMSEPLAAMIVSCAGRHRGAVGGLGRGRRRRRPATVVVVPSISVFGSLATASPPPPLTIRSTPTMRAAATTITPRVAVLPDGAARFPRVDDACDIEGTLVRRSSRIGPCGRSGRADTGETANPEWDDGRPGPNTRPRTPRPGRRRGRRPAARRLRRRRDPAAAHTDSDVVAVPAATQATVTLEPTHGCGGSPTVEVTIRAPWPAPRPARSRGGRRRPPPNGGATDPHLDGRVAAGRRGGGLPGHVHRARHPRRAASSSRRCSAAPTASSSDGSAATRPPSSPRPGCWCCARGSEPAASIDDVPAGTPGRELLAQIIDVDDPDATTTTLPPRPPPRRRRRRPRPATPRSPPGRRRRSEEDDDAVASAIPWVVLAGLVVFGAGRGLISLQKKRDGS